MRVELFPASKKHRDAPCMSEATKQPPKGSDWTRLLTDPDLVSHLGKLLQTYREVAPELRESALLRAMREIKDAAVAAREAGGNVAIALHAPEPIEDTPPFELDLLT